MMMAPATTVPMKGAAVLAPLLVGAALVPAAAAELEEASLVVEEGVWAWLPVGDSVGAAALVDASLAPGVAEDWKGKSLPKGESVLVEAAVGDGASEALEVVEAGSALRR